MLEVTKGTSVSIGRAKFAVQAYARRNKACHSGIYEQEAERNAEKLHEISSVRRRDLAYIIPEYKTDESLFINAIDNYQRSNIEGERRWKMRAKPKPRELFCGEVDITILENQFFCKPNNN